MSADYCRDIEENEELAELRERRTDLIRQWAEEPPDDAEFVVHASELVAEHVRLLTATAPPRSEPTLVEEPTDPEPNAVELSDDDLRAVQESLTDVSPAGASRRWEPLQYVLDKVGPPERLRSDPFQLLGDLKDVVADDLHICRHLPDDTKRAVGEYLAACANALKARTGSQLRGTFSRLTTFATDEVEAFVHGLSWNHEPRGQSWLDDADTVWAELRPEPREPETPATRPKRSSKSASSSSEPDDDFEIRDDVLALTRGKSAVVVGGSRREHARKRLEQAFEFDNLEWVETQGPREVNRAVTAMKNGSIQVAIVLIKFCSHAASRKFGDTDGDVVYVTGGYGVTNVERSIARAHGLIVE